MMLDGLLVNKKANTAYLFIYLVLLTTSEKIHKAGYLAINTIMVQQIHIHHISLQQFDIMEV